MAVRGIFRTCCVLLAQFLIVYLDHVHPEETAVTRKCSCYTFHGSETSSWTESRQECKKTGGDLVSMETKKEWEFICDAIESRSTAGNEWHIGLMKNNSMWSWVSGTRLNWAECNSTGCFPWQKHQPSGKPEKVALMVKGYPANTRGLFNDITAVNIKRGFICEHVTDTCLGSAVERCFNTTSAIQRTTERKPVFPPTTPLTTITKKSSPAGTVTNKQNTVPPHFTTTALPTTTRKFTSAGSVTNKQSTEESWKLDTPTQSPTITALPATTRKLTSGGTETNKQRTEKSMELDTIRAIVPSQSTGSGRPEPVNSGDSHNTLVIVAATSTAVALLVILSVMVTLLWRRKSHMRRGRSIRIKRKSNGREAAQTRGQLTFVFDGDRVHATMDWSKKKKKKRQGDFVYTDLINSNVIHETVRPALPTIYADIRSARGSCTDNQEATTNILESDSPTNKSTV